MRTRFASAGSRVLSMTCASSSKVTWRRGPNPLVVGGRIRLRIQPPVQGIQGQIDDQPPHFLRAVLGQPDEPASRKEVAGRTGGHEQVELRQLVQGGGQLVLPASPLFILDSENASDIRQGNGPAIGADPQGRRDRFSKGIRLNPAEPSGLDRCDRVPDPPCGLSDGVVLTGPHMEHVQGHGVVGRGKNTGGIGCTQPVGQVALEVECEQRHVTKTSKILQHMNGGSGLPRPHASHDRHVRAATGAVERER